MNMSQDPYDGFAEGYDWMVDEDPAHRQFFEQLFAKDGVKEVLDCACSTGHDLIMLNSIGCEVLGSDLSESMLAQAGKNLLVSGIDIPLGRAGFRQLPDRFEEKFDATICLTNAINEVLTDEGALQALHSIKELLRDGRIFVFDQGQTYANMENPAKFDVVETIEIGRGSLCWNILRKGW